MAPAPAVTPRLRLMAVLVNGGAVVVAIALVLGLCAVLEPPTVDGVEARLAWALTLLLWPGLILLLCVVAVMAMRALDGLFDPIGHDETRRYRVAQRVLANTAEQTLLLALCVPALAILLPAPRLEALTAGITVFCLGRVLFAAGYAIHPFARAPGMSMTLTVTGGGVLWGLGLLVL